MKNYRINTFLVISFQIYVHFYYYSLSFLFLITTGMSAQDIDTELTQQERSAVVDSMVIRLKSRYVFPDIADKMAEKIKENLKNGVYNSIKSPQKFARRLTEDLQSISNDKHLHVSFNTQRVVSPTSVVTTEDSLKQLHDYIEDMKRENFGFKEVKILDGNIGYLDLRRFSDIEYAGETAVSAMNFLCSSAAIIIDLRNNGGGHIAMIQLIASYFFNSKPVHLNTFYWRPTNSYTETWTLPYVPGKRRPDIAVYILISGKTFSAAEEFSYDLKNLKRATLIGETTRGGANPSGGGVEVTDRFLAWIPTGRAINPITKTNWEGTGVAPDIEVPANQALTVAHIIALKTLVAESQNEKLRRFYSWPLAALEVENNPVILKDSVLKSYIGTYDSQIVSFENGKLFFEDGRSPKIELIPINQNEFILEGLSFVRIRFIMENNKVVALERFYDDGESERSLKKS